MRMRPRAYVFKETTRYEGEEVPRYSGLVKHINWMAIRGLFPGGSTSVRIFLGSERRTW